jgi:hypothetical protein
MNSSRVLTIVIGASLALAMTKVGRAQFTVSPKLEQKSPRS